VDRLALNLGVSAQKSLGRNLDASEQMLLSGPTGVRVYRTIISGDNGYMASAELHYALWVPSIFESKFTHSLGVFVDLGGAWLEHNAYSDFKGARLQDVGGGYTARFGSLFGSLQWAHALGRRPASAQGESPERLLLQIGASI
jgi:hemolysin activation/secretion protein